MSLRLVDELRRLKDGGVPWDRAWACAAGANTGRHFRPTESDPGIDLPVNPVEIEPMSRFYYRVYREAYLDLGTPIRLVSEVEGPPSFVGMVRARRAA